MSRINILYPCLKCDQSDTDLDLGGRGAAKDKKWVLTCRNCGASWHSTTAYYAQQAALKELAEWNAKVSAWNRNEPDGAA